MALNIERFKKDLSALKERGILLECAMIRDTKGLKSLREALPDIPEEEYQAILKKVPTFNAAYQSWYSECIVLIKQLLPDRLDSFKSQYETTKSRKDLTFETYLISDYMIGLQSSRGGRVVADASAAIPKLQIQTAILGAASSRFDSSLFELRQLVQADLFDSEIDSARHLLKNKFVRAAGAIAGVVLEKHLAQVCKDHSVTVSKKNPGINDLNQLLKDASIIDIPQWRKITLLGDIRNLCDHNKSKEPTEDQVADLVDGVDRVLKTVA